MERCLFFKIRSQYSGLPRIWIGRVVDRCLLGLGR